MPVIINQERPDTTDAVTLINELEEYLASLYPITSLTGFSPEQLVKENVIFFIARKDGLPAGCGGIKLYGKDFGEVKRMYVRPEFRGSGLGRLMLRHIEEHTIQNGIRHIKLESGVYQPEAIRLYERSGYLRTGIFWPCVSDPLSLYYEKSL